MLRPMFGHRPKPKKFDLPLRYYDPKEDERKKRRVRIETRSIRKRSRQGPKVFAYALGLAFVVWVMSML
ncbi:MAG: hypothetical protein WDZ29_05580 [Balneolaceae bacterium]